MTAGILDAAQQVFEQYGARRANVEDVARTAGVSRSPWVKHSTTASRGGRSAATRSSSVRKSSNCWSSTASRRTSLLGYAR